jgi:hypothetical protein
LKSRNVRVMVACLSVTMPEITCKHAP